jgi:hypothetical protein
MDPPFSTTVLVVASMAAALVAQSLVARGLRKWRRARTLAESLEAAEDRPLAALSPPPRYSIRHLAEGERARFGDRWSRTQARFMDSPLAAVLEADRLVAEVIQARGYATTAGFDERAAGLSVAHPSLVHSYHMAHDLALKGHRGRATTEDLRQSMIHYRLMMDALVEPPSGRLEDR